jgi:hypothetical protein
MLEYLEAALRCPDATDNSWILYELGVVSFYAEKYEKSAEAFRRLRRAAVGHGLGVGVMEVAGSRETESPGDDGAFEFFGRVVRREKRGGFYIRSDDLTAFGDIYFSNRGERFYTARDDDRVSFEVGFNYKGILAIEVKRV